MNCKVVPFKEDDSYWGEISGIHIYTNQKIKSNYVKSELRKIISDYKIPKKIIISNNDSVTT